jgi:hypothetical protein
MTITRHVRPSTSPRVRESLLRLELFALGVETHLQGEERSSGARHRSRAYRRPEPGTTRPVPRILSPRVRESVLRLRLDKARSNRRAMDILFAIYLLFLLLK